MQTPEIGTQKNAPKGTPMPDIREPVGRMVDFICSNEQGEDNCFQEEE